MLLTDVLIHTRDIERPLGLPATLHPEGLRAALDYCCAVAEPSALCRESAPRIFDSRQLIWIGRPVTGRWCPGPAEAIMLAVTNRPVALPDLSGDGAKELGNRID